MAGDLLPPGASYAPRFLVPASILMALVLATAVARFFTRIQSRLLRSDDYVYLFALALTIPWFAMGVALYSYGRGIQDFMVDQSICGPLSVSMGVIWLWALNVVKISMCLMLLRLKDSKYWRWPLWSLIGLEVCLTIVATAIQLAFCRPLSGAWAPTPETVCIPLDGMKVYGYVYSAFNIATDVAISFMPLTFIVKMHRTRTEKVLIACLMGAGLSATTAAVVRLATVMNSPGEHSMAWLDVKIDILSNLELCLGMIAANLPTLKGPAHRLLVRLGLIASPNDRPGAEALSPSAALDQMTHGSHFRRQIEQLQPASQVSKASDEGAYASYSTTGDHGHSEKGSFFSSDDDAKSPRKP